MGRYSLDGVSSMAHIEVFVILAVASLVQDMMSGNIHRPLYALIFRANDTMDSHSYSRYL